MYSSIHANLPNCSSILSSKLLVIIKLDINVHVVSHSHHDPGWVMTVDNYYNIYVKNIYNNIFFNFLVENTNRTFVICEIVNFKRFYELDCNEDQKI